MRKVLLLSAIFFVAFCASTKAQNEGEFKPFKVDVSLGYALPIGGTGGKGGALFVVEPKYAVLPQISVGLRLEAAVTVAGVDMSTGTYNDNATAKAAASYLATADYYFTNSDLRPFAGAGVGLFNTAAASINNYNDNITSEAKFGGMVRTGIEYKHLRFGVEYNLIPKSTVPESSPSAHDGYTVQNSYVGIKLGVCIGGGRL